MSKSGNQQPPAAAAAGGQQPRREDLCFDLRSPTPPPKPLHLNAGRLGRVGSAIKLSMAMLFTGITFTIAMYDNSGSMYQFVPYVMRALSAKSRKKDGIELHAHFSCSLETNGNLPRTGLTNICLPFNQLTKFIDKHPTQRVIHVKMITDGGHNVSDLKDFTDAMFKSLKYANQKDVKLVFTVIMMGDYIRYNCWVCVLAYFCAMFNHICYVVYKPTVGEIMAHTTDEDGNVTWRRVSDPYANNSDAFGDYISHEMFIDFTQNGGALCYGNAFLKSAEMCGLSTQIKTECRNFWEESIIGSDDSQESSSDDCSTFRYPADITDTPKDKERLVKSVADFFTGPKDIKISSKLGMNATSDWFTAEMLEKGILFMPFIDMFSDEEHERRINNRTIRANIPPTNFVESTIGNPSRARLLELLINLSTVNVASYNAFVAFIRVNFKVLDEIVAVSIVKKSGSPIVKKPFVEAMIDMLTNKKPFFPDMTIEPSNANEYTRFISEVTGFCMVTSMDQYNVDPKTGRKDGLKQLFHVLNHLIFGMSAKQGFSENTTMLNAKLATQFGKRGGFLERLLALPDVADYFYGRNGLYEKIVADEKVSVGCVQQTELSCHQLNESAVMFEFLILLETTKDRPTYPNFCKSFVSLYAKMKFSGKEDTNPNRNWKNMRLKHPLMLALAVIQALHPADLDRFFLKNRELLAKYTIVFKMTKKILKPARCSECVRVIPAITEWYFVSTKTISYTFMRGTYEQRIETRIPESDKHLYPANSVISKIIPSQTIIIREDPCTDCYEEVPDSELKVLSNEIFGDHTFIKWLSECMVTRNLSKLTSFPGKAGTADSILTEVYKKFQKNDIVHHRKVSYYLKIAFGEPDYIIDSFRALFSSTTSPGDYDHLIPSYDKIVTDFCPGLIKHMSTEITGLEKTIGAERWMELLSVFNEELTIARLHLIEIHADAPIYSHGNYVCHVCDFIVEEPTLTGHEACILNMGIIPSNLLTPICTETAHGSMELGTINEATAIRAENPKFQKNYAKFISEYQHDGLLAKWHRFGNLPPTKNTIKELMNFRISSDQFMLLLKLDCKMNYMCRFNYSCELMALYTLNDVDFKTNELNRVFPLIGGRSDSRLKITNAVRKIFN